MIVVVGSINLDFVVRVQNHPVPGETVTGSDYALLPGGKGANQAVAAARMGADVRFVGAVGNDDHGHTLRQNLIRNHVNTTWVDLLPAPTGAAFVTVSAAGENTIVVTPGANGRLTPELLQAEMFDGATAILMQLEIPLQTMLRAAELGKKAGAVVILNAAPAIPLSDEDLRNIDVLVVNETEAIVMAGHSPGPAVDASDLARSLQAMGPTTIVTLGAVGVVWAKDGESGTLPSLEVVAVDSTGAGDAFVGALGAMLARGEEWRRALEYASAAGALAVTRVGAQESLPQFDDVDRYVQ